jgi:hypothetical protein
MASFSLKDIPSGGGSLSDGKYVVKFTDVEPGMSQKNNAKLTFKGVIAQAGNGYDLGRKFVYSRTLTPGAIGFLKADLEAAGVPSSWQCANPFEEPQDFAKDVASVFVGKLFDIAASSKTQTSGEFAGRVNTEYTVLGRVQLGGAGASAYDSV